MTKREREPSADDRGEVAKARAETTAVGTDAVAKATAVAPGPQASTAAVATAAVAAEPQAEPDPQAAATPPTDWPEFFQVRIGGEMETLYASNGAEVWVGYGGAMWRMTAQSNGVWERHDL